MASNYMPINILVKGSRVLVVGGGNVALRKIEMLLDYEPEITVIAPEVVDKIEYFAGRQKIGVEKREYRSPEAKDYGLVISAADDRDVNSTVYDDCRAANVPVNVVDNPGLCTFIVPAIVKRDSLTVAVSTDGKAPFLSQFLRILLEDAFPSYYSKVVRFAHAFRKDVHRRFKEDPGKKSRSFERFLATDWKEVTKKMSDEEIKTELEKLLED